MSARGDSLKRTGSAVLASTTTDATLRREVREVFARYDKGGDGSIDEADLTLLLRDLTGKQPTKSEVLFVLRGVDTSADGKISLDEFYEYWRKVKAGHPGGGLNKLLVRDKVGTVRLSSYDLPPANHAFGMKNPEQEFDAKDVIGGWNGREGEAPRVGAHWKPQRKLDAYGRANRPSTPVSSVIKAEYAGGMATAKETAYPTLPTRTKVVPHPKSTATTQLRSTVVATRLQDSSVEKKPWKMSKFEKVKSKLVAPSSTSPSGQDSAPEDVWDDAQ